MLKGGKFVSQQTAKNGCVSDRNVPLLNISSEFLLIFVKFHFIGI